MSDAGFESAQRAERYAKVEPPVQKQQFNSVLAALVGMLTLGCGVIVLALIGLLASPLVIWTDCCSALVDRPPTTFIAYVTAGVGAVFLVLLALVAAGFCLGLLDLVFSCMVSLGRSVLALLHRRRTSVVEGSGAHDGPDRNQTELSAKQGTA